MATLIWMVESPMVAENVARREECVTRLIGAMMGNETLTSA